MKLEEAIEDTKKRLAQGDKETGSTSWSGGGFRAEAIRLLLEAVSDHAPARAGSVTQDGWKMVPVEPTPDMLDAGLLNKKTWSPDILFDAGATWKAMLAVAPPQPDRNTGEAVWRTIESAPRNGSIIVIGRWMHPYGFIRAFAYWADTRGISGWVPTGAASSVPGVLGLAEPSHWMSIEPPAPSTPTQTEEEA